MLNSIGLTIDESNDDLERTLGGTKYLTLESPGAYAYDAEAAQSAGFQGGIEQVIESQSNGEPEDFEPDPLGLHSLTCEECEPQTAPSTSPFAGLSSALPKLPSDFRFGTPSKGSPSQTFPRQP